MSRTEAISCLPQIVTLRDCEEKNLLAYSISHLKEFLCAASGMLISLNDVIMPACNLEKDDKVVKNVWPKNAANTISHRCSLISRSIQVSCNLFE